MCTYVYEYICMTLISTNIYAVYKALMAVPGKIFNSHIILYKKKELTSDKSRPMKQGKVTLCYSFLLV